MKQQEALLAGMKGPQLPLLMQNSRYDIFRYFFNIVFGPFSLILGTIFGTIFGTIKKSQDILKKSTSKILQSEQTLKF